MTASFWISAYRRRLEQEGIPCTVVARGDETAGAVLVKCATMDGKASLHHRTFDLESGERRWMVLTEGDEAECDAAARRQRGFDPDLWVLEVEDRRGRHMLGDKGLD
ncbi:DUF1491 family protein [Jannaschia sp. W003]|uniref:DUF1491 family protein n=1 Tax=Jannaschia sp. W003 TaxID=2867012 RepID=UPI0021A4A61C|nr:DUF1491 family protein [Jannaschia sp. W003]UWQ22898.1 DUF1491 family protein [Jannaschia sp. W003]